LHFLLQISVLKFLRVEIIYFKINSVFLAVVRQIILHISVVESFKIICDYSYLWDVFSRHLIYSGLQHTPPTKPVCSQSMLNFGLEMYKSPLIISPFSVVFTYWCWTTIVQKSIGQHFVRRNLDFLFTRNLYNIYSGTQILFCSFCK
jgi:hypothetical protein